jgi:hypothetical protein
LKAENQKLKTQVQIQINNVPNSSKCNNVQLSKVKSLTTTNYEIAKLAFALYTMRNHIQRPLNPNSQMQIAIQCKVIFEIPETFVARCKYQPCQNLANMYTNMHNQQSSTNYV